VHTHDEEGGGNTSEGGENLREVHIAASESCVLFFSLSVGWTIGRL